MTEMSKARRTRAQDELARCEVALMEASAHASAVRSLLSDSRHYDLAQLTVVDTAALRQQVATLSSYLVG